MIWRYIIGGFAYYGALQALQPLLQWFAELYPRSGDVFGGFVVLALLVALVKAFQLGDDDMLRRHRDDIGA